MAAAPAKDKPLTPQQERFCQAVLVERTLFDAYVAAYPTARKWQKSGVYSKASNLAASAKIQSRLAELRLVSAAPAVITVQWVRDGMAETYAEARKRGQLGTAAKILELAGRSLGMFVDRIRLEDGEVEQARLRIREFAASNGVTLSAEDEAAAIDEAVRVAIGSTRAARLPAPRDDVV